MLFTLLLLLCAVMAAATPVGVKRPITIPMTRHHLGPESRAALKRNFQLAGRDDHTVSLGSSRHSAYYSIGVEIGNPPQTVPMMLDTGSLVPWVFGEHCKQCPDVVFNSDQSESFTATEKEFGVGYSGNHNVLGYSGLDTFAIGDVSVSDFFFGVGNSTSNTAPALPIAGIFGWQRNDESFIVRALSQMSDPYVGLFSRRTIQGDEDKAYNMAGDYTSDGGALTIGGVDDKYMGGDINWVERGKDTDGWSAKIQGVKVNGKDVDLTTSTGHFDIGEFDTGSPGCAVPLSLASNIFDLVPGAQQDADDATVWWFPCDSPPVVSLVMNGQDYPISQLDFGVERREDDGMCKAVIIAQHNIDTLAIGSPFFRNVYTVLRYGDDPAMGFARLAKDVQDGGVPSPNSVASAETPTATKPSATSLKTTTPKTASPKTASPKTASPKTASPKTNSPTATTTTITKAYDSSTPTPTTSGGFMDREKTSINKVLAAEAKHHSAVTSQHDSVASLMPAQAAHYVALEIVTDKKGTRRSSST